MNNLFVKITALALVLLSCLFIASCSQFEGSDGPDKKTVMALEESEKASETAPSYETEASSEAETTSEKFIPPEYFPSNAEAEEDLSRDDYMLAAHRGYAAHYPESTLQAFKRAYKKGFDAIECDVWETADGSFLIQHDPTTTRTTGKRQYIWRLNKKTRYDYPIVLGDNVEKYKVRNIKLIIPSLEEVLSVVKKYNGYLFLHIKNSSKYLLSKSGEKRIMRLLKAYGLKDKTLIFGGAEYVKPFTRHGFKTGLYATPKSRKQFVHMANWCEKNNVDTLVIANMKCLRSYRYDRGIVKFLKRKNMDFGVYKATSIKQAEYFRSLGAWFSMSDKYVRKIDKPNA